MTTDTSILERIVAKKRDDLPWRHKKEPLDALKRRITQLKEQAEGRADQWSLRQAIVEGPRGPLHGGKRIQIVAEIKKSIPGKGRIATEFERRALPRTYTHNGATAIAVVTEPSVFMGDVLHLLETRNILDGYYPGGRPSLLRRDWLFDPYHMWESRGFGADAVSLKVDILDDAQLRNLMALAAELEMDAFVEAHDERGVERALAAGAVLIGIDNHDPHTYAVDLAVTERLRPLIPSDRTVVGIGGVTGPADAERMAAAGAQAILVGEALITSKEMRRALQDLLI